MFVFYRTRHRDRVYFVDKHVRQMVGKVGQDVSGVRDTTMATLHVELQRCAPPLDSFLFWCISIRVRAGGGARVAAAPPNFGQLRSFGQQEKIWSKPAFKDVFMFFY